MEYSSSPQALLDKLPALAARFRIALRLRAEREKLRILVVEDQLFSRKLLFELLHHEHDVDEAESAKDGMRLYMEMAPDIVLLDIELTDQSGHKLAHFIKSVDPNAFVIMVTANNSVEDVATAKMNKVDGFIVKPYNKSKVLDCVGKYFAKHPDRQQKGPAP